MILQRPNFHILTGGPGAGKTTILEALRNRGFLCVDEAARQILKAQAAIGGNATHDGDRVRYRDLTLERSIAAFKAVAERVAPVFFDRGIAEMLRYAVPEGDEPPARVQEAIRRCRYSPPGVHLPTLARNLRPRRRAQARLRARRASVRGRGSGVSRVRLPTDRGSACLCRRPRRFHPRERPAHRPVIGNVAREAFDAAWFCATETDV